MDPAELQKLKDMVEMYPAFIAEEEFPWPFVGTEAKFTNCENIEEDFKDVRDGRKAKNIDNMDEMKRLPIREIEVGKKVIVEYTVVLYLGRKATDNDEGFSAGCSLELLSISLLSDGKGGKEYGGINSTLILQVKSEEQSNVVS